MIKLSDFRSASPTDIFYISAVTVDYESGEILSDILKECNIIKYLGKGYFYIRVLGDISNLKINRTGEIATHKSLLHKTNEEAVKDHNIKIKKSINHIAKLTKLGKILSKRLIEYGGLA